MGWVVVVTEVVAVAGPELAAVVPADDGSTVDASVGRCWSCSWSVTVVVDVVVVASGKVVTDSILVSCCCCGCSGLSISFGTWGDSGRVWLASIFAGVEALVE